MSTDDSPEREVVVYDREGYPRASVEDEEGPSNVSEKEDVSNPLNSTEKTKSCRTPRREVRWLDLGARNRSLESIKQRFQDRLDRFLSSSNSLLRHITSPMDSKLIHNLHQCPGYLREEITLASDVSKSVIVSHAFPSQSEVCSICGQLVQYNRTEPSIVDGEKLEAPRYPSQDSFRNMASLSPLSSSMEGATFEPADTELFISFFASLSPSLRQIVLMDQDDDFLRTLPSHMIAEAGVYRDEAHARRPRNPTAFASEQGLPATGISQYEALAEASGSQKVDSVVSVGERSHSRQLRSSNNVPSGSQTDVLPAQVPKVNVTTGRTANASRKQDANSVCSIPGCGATFTPGFNLKGHLRSHFEEKPYKCHLPGCGKRFARQHDCKRHEQLHPWFDMSGIIMSSGGGGEDIWSGVSDLGSGFNMSGITMSSVTAGGGMVVEFGEEQKQSSIPMRRRTGGDEGANICPVPGCGSTFMISI